MASSDWYYSHQGQKFGPFSGAQLKQLVAGGKLLATDLVFRDGGERWVPATSIKGLFPQAGDSGPIAIPARAPVAQPKAAGRPMLPWLIAASALGVLAAAIIVIVIVANNKGSETDQTIAAGKPDPAVKPAGEGEKRKDPSAQEPLPGAGKPKDNIPDPKNGTVGDPVEVKKDPNPPEEVKKDPKEPPAEVKNDPPEKKGDPKEVERAAQLKGLLAAGRAALKAKQYDLATKAFTDAGKLSPGNEEAMAGLEVAQAGQKVAEAQEKATKEQDTKRAAFRVLLESGLTNLEKKQYPAAIVALNEALKLEPKSEEAKAALRDAEEGLSLNPPPANAKAEQQKKLDAYRKLIADGRSALDSMRDYDAAIAAFTEAQQLFPGDRTSATFLQLAQKAKADAASSQTGQPAMLTEAQKYVVASQNALLANDFIAASQALQQARLLAPNDPAVLQARLDFLQRLQLLQIEAAGRQRLLRDYLKLLRIASDALALGRYDDAINASSAALYLIPDDPRAQDLLNQAVFAARRAIRLQQLLATIYDSLNKKLIRVAQVTLIEAVRLAPDDPAVRKAALDVDASQRPVQLDPAREQRLIAYRKAMRAGQDALDTRRYNDAINGFTTAGNIVRDDPDRSLFQAAEQGRKAAVEARRAAVRDLVAAGWTALDAKRPKDAKKAVDSAKQLAPADAEVRRLDQAVNDALRPPPTRYTLRISPATIELARKGQATAQVTVDRTSGYQGQITVELHKLPMGVTATPVTIPAGQTTGSITLRAASNARLGRATGAYAVGTRSSGTDVNSSTFTVNVK